MNRLGSNTLIRAKKKKNIVKRNNRRISPKNLTKLSISKLIGFQFGVENKI